MSASIWEGTEKRWSPSQETCLDCIRLKLPSKVSIHTCLWDMECLISNELFTCREPWTGFMHCIKRQGESLRLPNVLLYHGIFLRKQVSRFSACRIRAAAVRRPFFYITGNGSARMGWNYGNTVPATVFGQDQEMYGALSDFLIMVFIMVCEAVTQSIFLSESTVESPWLHAPGGVSCPLTFSKCWSGTVWHKLSAKTPSSFRWQKTHGFRQWSIDWEQTRRKNKWRLLPYKTYPKLILAEKKH